MNNRELKNRKVKTASALASQLPVVVVKTTCECSIKNRHVFVMVNGLHLYSAFIQSALQRMSLIHPFTHTFTHQRRLAAMQGTNQLIRSN